MRKKLVIPIDLPLIRIFEWLFGNKRPQLFCHPHDVIKHLRAGGWISGKIGDTSTRTSMLPSAGTACLPK
jgi:hypothetical protein